MTTQLQLAIHDPELGPRIRKVRIATPEDRTPAALVGMIREKMEDAGLLGPDHPQAEKLRALLQLALEDGAKRYDLIEQWLDEEERARLGWWTHGEGAFVEIEEALLIRDFIVREYRPELRPFTIAVVFQEEVPPVNRRGRLGTMMKLPGKMKHLSGAEAVMTLGFLQWSMLTDMDRQRLVHHELEHLIVDEGLKIRGHDFEDFISVIELYGLRSQSERFSTDGAVANTLENVSSQLELLDDVA